MIDFVYSDPHFGHSKIIDFCERPFADEIEMGRELVWRYNAVVSKADTVLWLGDCFFVKDAEAVEILHQMNGNKILVRGNHDKRSARMAAIGFHLVADEFVFESRGYTFRACHYPYKDINNQDQRYKELRPTRRPGEILLHGHTHQREAFNLNAIHCGVDAWDYAPVSMPEICDQVADGMVWPA